MFHLRCWFIILTNVFLVEANICEPVLQLLGDKEYQATITIGKNVILAEWLNQKIPQNLQTLCFPQVQIVVTGRFNGAW